MIPEFDTRDTKPKLRPLRVLTGLAAAALGVLALTDLSGHAAAMSFVTAAYALGMALALLWAWREQIRYNPYSYNTIFYMGFALFALSVMLTHLVLAARILRNTSAVRLAASRASISKT